ncbi:SpoIIE family protein phosphatase [Limibacter armeniacum]|uniref:SpoIIE family protein phosphatase n=1 Tax=Limibacter armeniacum TaxID=466084 RepID=UPI002FE541BB
MRMTVLDRLRCIACLLLFGCLTGFFTQVQAQNFKTYLYNKDNGLNSEQVRDIAKDSLGYLWLATDAGLVKYGGQELESFEGQPLALDYFKSLLRRKDGSLIALSDNNLIKVNVSPTDLSFETLLKGQNVPSDSALYYGKSLYEDSQRQLWVADAYRIFRLNGDGSFDFFSMDERNAADDVLKSYTFTEDKNGNLYAINYNGFAYRFDGSTFKEIENTSLPKQIQFVLHEDGNKFIVCSFDKGLGVWEVSDKGKTKYTTIDKNIDPTHAVKMADGSIWISTATTGMHVLNTVGNKYTLSRHAQIGIYNAYFMLVDGHNIWTATNQGLRQYQQLPFKSLAGEHTDGYIQHIVQSSNGQVYFTDGLSVYEGNITVNGDFHLARKADTKGNTFIRLLPSGKGIWASDTQGTLTYWEDGQKIRTIDLTDLGKAIYIIEKDSQGNLWICQDDVYGPIRVDGNGRPKVFGSEDGIFGNIIVMKQTPSGVLYAGGSSVDGYLFRYNAKKGEFENLSQPLDFLNNTTFEITDIAELSDKSLVLGTSQGVLHYKDDKVTLIDLGQDTRRSVKGLAVDPVSGDLWIAGSTGLICVDLQTQEVILFSEKDGMSAYTFNNRTLMTDLQGNIYGGTTAGIIIGSNFDRMLPTQTPILQYGESNGKKYKLQEGNEVAESNYLRVFFDIPAFPRQNVSLEMRILGKDNKWIPVNSTDEYVQIDNLSPRSYTLQLRARAAGNNFWSTPAVYHFSVYKQWYLTWWAISIYCVGFALLIVLIVKLNLYRINREKRKLEEMVNNRTHEVELQAQELTSKNKELNSALNRLKRSEAILNHNAQELESAKKDAEKGASKLMEQNLKLEESARTVREQNMELTDHRDQIIKQSNKLKDQQELLAKQHENMMSSVNYARRIQRALLGEPEDVETKVRNLGEEWDSFILFKPRDIVSGDFYWFTEKGGRYIIAAGDCTGHGIPGAFMSLIGNDLLHQIVHERGILEPSRILKSMHIMIQKALHQKDYESRDGMDISICIINPRLNTLAFAGAGNPLYYVPRNNPTEMMVVKGQHHGVGGKDYKGRRREFKTHVLRIEDVDTFYIFSDGYIDQFGGREGRKLMSRNFRRMLFDMHTKACEEQRTGLDEFLKQWTADGHFKQVDDILVVGVKCQPFEYAQPDHADEELSAEAMDKNLIM